MKFDFCIGNPPYQQETENKSQTNGQRRRKSIFQHFQIEADKIAKKSTVLIYPAGRWIQRSGKGLSEFGLDQINDPRLQKIYFFPNSKEVFSNTDITDGVSVVVKKAQKKTNGFDYIFCENGTENCFSLTNPGDNIIPLNPNDISVATKIEAFTKKEGLKYLHDRILPQKLFGIESDFVEMNADKVKKFCENAPVDYLREVKLYTNDKAGPAGRAKWFIVDRAIIAANPSYIDEWKVIVSSAHPGGQEGRDWKLEIADNHSAFGRSRVALGSFKTESEAQNFFRYVSSIVIRFAFLLTDEALTSLAKLVPDIENYTESNMLIDFSGDIDKQLITLLSLTPAEVHHIESRVANSRKKEME